MLNTVRPFTPSCPNPNLGINGQATSVLSAFEMSYIQQYTNYLFNGEDYFIGGYLRDYNYFPYEWMWNDGNDMTYTNWDVGQPKNITDPNYNGWTQCNGGYCGIAVNATTGRWYSAQFVAGDASKQVKNVVCKVPQVENQKGCPWLSGDNPGLQVYRMGQNIPTTLKT